MAPYIPLVVCRSDGLAEYLHNGERTLNQPKPQDLDPTPNAQGQVSVYRKVGPDDMKSLQWRRKLAGMLVDLLGGAKHKHKQCILQAFPEDYVLWQQLKYSEGATSATAPKKSHAAAGAERNDAYLFGHPSGRSKKYRSPQEFFPHLLWLVTDKAGDPLNCSCKHCAPEKRNTVDNNHEDDDEEDTLEILPPSKKVDESKLGSSSADRNAKTATKPASSTPAVTPATSAPPKSQLHTSKKTPEQEFDGQANSTFIYRPGELTWFNKGTAWGLAVVCRRKITDGQAQYLLQPLSNPMQLATPQLRRHDMMRPWLAWSVPPTTFGKLNQMRFEDVPWDKVIRGDFREPNKNGDAVVDGSILAARAVDASYSLFDRLIIPTAPNEAHYNGMFLGGEKIWVGEPVRLYPPTSSQSDILVMVINHLIEIVSSAQTSLTLVGDVYQLTTVSSTTAPSLNPALPARMQADIFFRNEVAARALTNQFYEWKKLESSTRRALSSVRGRWYETKPLMATIKTPDQASRDIMEGKTEDISSVMNGRMGSKPGLAQRKKNRLDSLGGSVPAGLKISKGLNGPPEDNNFGEGLGLGGSMKNESVSDFMDLDQGAESYYGGAL